MRNLKKFLALVLAMMMTFSLMVTVNAAATSDFTDADAITDEFSEAVAVLEGLGVFKGYTNGDKFDFRPQNNITRAEVATIVYRLATGDVAGDRSHLYEGGAKKFKDVPDDHWASGEIGYCANNLLVRGYDDTRFGPNDYVTGVQAVTMILRAVGYGQGGEFEGWGWETRAYGRARSEGLLENVDNTNYTGKLTDIATRELVAELLFQASLIPQVTWTEALGYNKYTTLSGSTLNADLAWENFRLNVSPYTVIDEWGRPGYYWFKGSALNATRSNVVATIKADPVKTYDKAVNECDVAHDLDFTGYRDYNLYVNSNAAFSNKYRVEATDVITKVGGQGRITEFYNELVHPWTARNGSAHPNWARSVVMIDTFLAKVTKVEKEVLDAAGHQMIPAKLTLMVYDGYSDSEAGTNAKSVPAGNERVAVKASGNWEFAKGDFVTLNAYTNHANGINVNDARNSHTGTAAANNAAAFEAEQTAIKTNTTNQFDYVENITKCEPVLGKQTTIYWNQGKHNVNNEDKLDQLDLHLDVAGSTVNTTFAWYYDAKGNLIGIGDAPANINYGIITSIYSAFKQGEANTTGEAVAIANVKYADGTEGTVTIDKFYVNANITSAADTAGHLTTVDGMIDSPAGTTVDNDTAGVAELLPIYDNGSQVAMTSSERDVTGGLTHATQAGWLHVAPVSAVNANQEIANSTIAMPWGNDGATDGAYGVIKGNLFKFVNSGDNTVTAIEVAGDDTNTGMYDNHYNAVVSMTGTDVDDTAAELSKNYAYLTYVKDGDDATNNLSIRMDNDTKIIVRGAKMDATNDFTEATNTITVYDGIDELPSSILVPDESEIDWADIDGNGIADVVYVYGLKKGVSGYGLFYYNGSAGQWTGSAATGSGWLRGWLDGKETDLTFTNKALFDRIQQSTVEYGGHLFAVKLFDGEVDTLLGTALTATHGDGDKDYFLIDDASGFVPETPAVVLSSLKEAADLTAANFTVADGIKTLHGTAAFGFGTDNGNDYVTGSTSAIWLHDDGQKQNVDGTYTDVRYNANTNTIETVTYTVTGGKTTETFADGRYTVAAYLSGNSAIAGDGLYFLNIANRVNDVTLVLEGSANDTIRQLYVTTRPDITPPDGSGTVTDKAGTPGADVLKVTGLTTDQLDDYLKAAGPNKVLTSNVMADATWTGSQASELMYFPFNAKTAAKGATLTVLNKDGSVVYLESVTDADAAAWAADEGHYFGVNFAKKPAGSTAVIHKVFTTGTYTFTIVDTTGVTLSAGSFTMG